MGTLQRNVLYVIDIMVDIIICKVSCGKINIKGGVGVGSVSVVS
jgi:hypothetical protein